MNLTEFIRRLIEAIRKFFVWGDPGPDPAPPPEEERYFEKGYIRNLFIKKKNK